MESILATTLPRPSYFVDDSGDLQVAALPDELDPAHPLVEGAGYQITVNAYERNPYARRRCIAAQGTACAVCGFSFGAAYGPAADGYIHVHHIRPLSEIRGEYEVNPDQDLKPVCPNCHAVLHLRIPPYTIDEVRGFLRQQSLAERGAADSARI